MQQACLYIYISLLPRYETSLNFHQQMSGQKGIYMYTVEFHLAMKKNEIMG